MICAAIFKDISRSMITSNMHTRNNSKLVKLPKVKLEYARQSLSFAAAKIYNDFPIDIRSEKNFKSLLDIHFV